MGTRLLIASLTAGAVAAVVAGVMALGSPAAARERRFDERREDDLAEIERVINEYHGDHSALPHALTHLNRRSGDTLLRDPVTQQPYKYRVLDDHRYELCAVFQQPSRRSLDPWAHDSGAHCFVRKPVVR